MGAVKFWKTNKINNMHMSDEVEELKMISNSQGTIKTSPSTA